MYQELQTTGYSFKIAEENGKFYSVIYFNDEFLEMLEDNITYDDAMDMCERWVLNMLHENEE